MQRLRRNHGRYHGESIDIDAVQAEIHELRIADRLELRNLLDLPGISLRGYQRAAPGAPATSI